MQMNWQQQGRTVFDLDSAEISMLVDYAENGFGKASVISKGVLEFGYGYHYCDCLPADSSTMKSSIINYETPKFDNGLYIKAKPNPADTWVAFDYKIPLYIGEAILTITDINGRIIKRFTINSEVGQKVWDIRKIPTGVYFYRLEAGNNRKSDKLIIK